MVKPKYAHTTRHVDNYDLIEHGKLRCNRCNRVKPVHLYFKASNAKLGYRLTCKACVKKHHPLTEDKKRDYKYRTTYGITLDEYDELLRKQGGRCYICHRKPGKIRLAVDHDHAVEKEVGSRASVRGLLCKLCNRYLGLINDDLEAMARAIEYLKKERPYENG